MFRFVIGRGNERGGALPIALAAAALLTFIGLVLLGIVRQGFAQAHESEETVRAELLAQKGIDEAQGIIRLAVQKANNEADYKRKVENIQAALGLMTLSGKRQSGSLHDFLDGRVADGLFGTYEIEILDDVDNYEQFADNIDTIPDYPYSRVVTVRSTGKTGSVLKKSAVLERTIVVSTINPVFYYPLSAEENIYLNGASTIVGDVLAREGHIYTSDVAKFVGLPGSDYAKKTDFPSFEGFFRESNDGTKPAKQFSKHVPFEDVRMPLDENISITAYVDDKISELHAAMPAPNTGINYGGISAHVLPANSIGPLKFENQWIDVSGPGTTNFRNDLAILDGVLTVLPFADFQVRNGSVYVRHSSASSAAADLAGTIILDSGEEMVVDGDVVIHDGFRFRGNLYINGNLQIIGSINIDGTIYVNGDAELKRSKTINGDTNWSDKPLILLASGNIAFTDSRPDDDPAELRAFFYSERDIYLYGVQTKLSIRGGVHGKNVTLNAVREGASSTRTDTTYDGTPLPGEQEYRFTPTSTQKDLGPERSNLQIRYDNMLYLDPPQGVPVTDHVTVFMKNQ